MAHEYRRIPVAASGEVNLDSVPEMLEQLSEEQFMDRVEWIDPDYALQYGRFVLPMLTGALSDKIGNIELYRRKNDPDNWRLIYRHLPRSAPPNIRWGVCGASLVAGTVAAELAIQREAQKAGYTSELDFPPRAHVDPARVYYQTWYSQYTMCRLTITNPDLRTYSEPKRRGLLKRH